MAEQEKVNSKLKKLLSNSSAGKTKIIEDILDILGERKNNDRIEIETGVEAEVLSVIDLNENIKEKIKKVLENKTGLNIKIKNRIDKSILGGIIIKIGDRVIDLSIKNKIEDLRAKLRSIKLEGGDFDTKD
ncbi:MAG: ATP synthase F1 subunit delta [Actinobacteria bacterium]|nr:ATP synthase F1 subunit delta [Actinomycetota bacterium]